MTIVSSAPPNEKTRRREQLEVCLDWYLNPLEETHSGFYYKCWASSSIM